MIKCPNCERKWFENTKAAEVIEESNKCIICCTETLDKIKWVDLWPAQKNLSRA
jgi:hypothetical protein